ncbi:hypothetical protein [Streptomyces sp. TLI_171]|uniref:hypothetical protein n=1 Tax=Streptomyces sp. TLI_171 TaxID=1938859 RepID=UPI000C17406D|nr:hypothetical protein [Streptomyces sp. TLI_171]RKE02995.1 hypothetical protein BX266_7602 [Streptomyces sp. TLI_171]
MSYAPVLVCLPPTDPEDVEAAVQAALDPTSLYTDEQWHERTDWCDELAPDADEGQDLAPDAVIALLAASTDRDWRHELSPGGVVRYFELTDWNPHGQWQEYEIGGPFSGMFHVAAGTDQASASLIRSPGCAQGRADGGPLRLLDLDAGWREARRAAAEQFDRWAAITAGVPGIRALADDDAEPGRTNPAVQPQVALTRAKRPGTGAEAPATLLANRDRLINEAGLVAVTASALLTVDGVWLADPQGGHRPGPRTAASLAYHREANLYLDALDPDSVIVLVSITR